MPRPTVITNHVLSKLEQAFALGCTDAEACLFANISPATLYNYQEKKPGFLERKEVLKQAPILKARATVIKALENDPDLALKFLERRKKDEFSTKHNFEHTVREVIPILGGASSQELATSNSK